MAAIASVRARTRSNADTKGYGSFSCIATTSVSILRRNVRFAFGRMGENRGLAPWHVPYFPRMLTLRFTRTMKG
ncbi:hypothetical protein D3C86_2024970 [compost metagenome]